jgi:hypothetical protein
MAVFADDQEVLCLISAFQEIKSRGMRRAVLMLLEELAQKEATPSQRKTRRLKGRRVL